MAARLSDPLVRRLVRDALREDFGDRGDVTSIATIPASSRSTTRMIAKENGVVCGLAIAVEAFRQLDRHATIKLHVREGAKVRRGQIVLALRGKTRAILSAERVALNFVQQLSGVATLTHRFVEAAGHRVRILDTRKTTPLLRTLEKHAVRCGGGTNHRFGLHDQILIKDNHLAALAHHPHPILEAVARARKHWPKLTVEVECDTLAQVREAVEAKADILLLDNMTPAQLRQAVRLVRGRAKMEASGGVTLKNVGSIARTGVDCISIGALTHSAPALDFSLEVELL